MIVKSKQTEIRIYYPQRNSYGPQTSTVLETSQSPGSPLRSSSVVTSECGDRPPVYPSVHPSICPLVPLLAITRDRARSSGNQIFTSSSSIFHKRKERLSRSTDAREGRADTQRVLLAATSDYWMQRWGFLQALISTCTKKNKKIKNINCKCLSL